MGADEAQSPPDGLAERLSARTVRLYTRFSQSVCSLGTGFLIVVDGGAYVVTAGHCLADYVKLRQSGQPAVVDVAAGDGRASLSLTGVIKTNRNPHTAAEVGNPLNRDIGLLPLDAEQRAYMAQTKAFFDEAHLRCDPLLPGEPVWFFGFPGPAQFDPNAAVPYSQHHGQMFGTESLIQTGSLTELRGFVKTYGIGDAALSGTSGSALVDEGGLIRGVVLGGREKKDRIYAWIITGVLDLIREAYTK